MLQRNTDQRTLVLRQPAGPFHHQLLLSLFSLQTSNSPQMQPPCFSLPLTPEASGYLVPPPPVTRVSDGAGQSGDWKGQVRLSQVCQPQGKAFHSQLPPVGRGCPQRMNSGRAPHKGKSAGPEVSGTHHTAASRKPRPKL